MTVFRFLLIYRNKFATFGTAIESNEHISMYINGWVGMGWHMRIVNYQTPTNIARYFYYVLFSILENLQAPTAPAPCDKTIFYQTAKMC